MHMDKDHMEMVVTSINSTTLHSKGLYLVNYRLISRLPLVRMIVASIRQMHKINHDSLRYESFEGTHICSLARWNILNVVLRPEGWS